MVRRFWLWFALVAVALVGCDKEPALRIGLDLKPDAFSSLKERCGREAPQVQQQSLAFPDPGVTCDFGNQGNLGRINRVNTARAEQVVLLNLPADADLCEIEFAPSTQSMKYDDEILLTLNHVVVASSSDFSSLFQVVDGFVRYDWSRLVNTVQLKSLGPQSNYCAGRASGEGSCSIPKTETLGTMSLTLAPDLLKRMWIADKASRESGVKPFVSFITLGDNDTNDCRHDGFALDITLKYVR